MSMDPHVRKLVRAFSLTSARPEACADIRHRREAFRGLMRFSETGARLAGSEDRCIWGAAGPIAVRLYTPLGVVQPYGSGLVFLHGGGLVCGDLDTHDALCRTLCEDAGCKVIAVDYRLAPEHPYPAAVEDAHRATLWVIDHAAALGLDPRRIAIGGDSAGAGLAAAVCRRLALDRPGALALQLLLCPVLDWGIETLARRDFSQAWLLDRETMEREHACYVPLGQDPAHPDISPLCALDVGGQPPAHIHTAEFDPVRDDGRAYADRLREAGVAASYVCHPGMVHLFYGLGRLVPYARAALQAIGADLRVALA